MEAVTIIKRVLVHPGLQPGVQGRGTGLPIDRYVDEEIIVGQRPYQSKTVSAGNPHRVRSSWRRRWTRPETSIEVDPVGKHEFGDRNIG
jgi:hypothetical protein